MIAEPPVVKATVRMERPDRHFYQIEMIFPKGAELTRTLQMPVWTPGSYKVRDFARNVEQLGAFTLDGESLPWRKRDKSTWVISVPRNQPFKVAYLVFAYEFSVRTSYLDSFYGFINPASVFFYEPSAMDRPIEVDVIPWQDWSSASALAETGANRYRAENYDELVDSPFQFGKFRRYDFDVNGIPHQWIIAGDVNMNETAMMRSLRQIGLTVGNLFNGYPFRKYTIFSQFRLDGKGGGGLEHRNSTMVQGRGNGFRDKRGWNRFLGLMIHEYFHAWNVKAIRDKALGPFDYQKEIYTELLWLHEGWTSYYDTMLMQRAGFWTDKELRKEVAKQVDGYLQRPGIQYQSLSDASFNAWIHQYQNSETRYNSQVSYYRGGAMSGLALDLFLRRRTKNTVSLDDLMRILYNEYALKGKGLDWNEIVSVVAGVTGNAGIDFMERHIGQANPFPFESLLAHAGLKMVYEDADADEKGDGDEAAEDGDKPYEPNPLVTLGVDVSKRNGAVLVSVVRRGGAGWRAGLDYGDEILAVNERRVTADNFDRILGWSRPGDEVNVLISRAKKILNVPVKLEAAPKKLKLVPDEDADELAREIYTAMFGGQLDEARTQTAKKTDRPRP